MPKVSIIVPVYGVEKYIERCARSLFEQTLDDIEYIFIDDCTPDDSIKNLNRVLSYYPSRKGQVHIIQLKQNSGQAVVRMKGIEAATGDFLMFCDSDDWMDKEMCSTLYHEAVQTNSSVVICDFYIANDEKNYSKKVESISNIASIDSIIKDVITQKISSSLWNKLISRRIVPNNLFAPKGNMGEDLVLLIQFLYNCDKASYIGKPLYYYYDNSSSITRAISPSQIYSKFLQSESNTGILEKYLIENNLFNKFEDDFLLLKLRKINLLLPIIRFGSYYQIWKNTYPELRKGVFWSKSIPLKEKIKYYLTYSGIIKS